MVDMFYSNFAELMKVSFFIILVVIIGLAIWRSWKKGGTGWRNWIHGAILTLFVVNSIYCGSRCLTTDPINDMIVRRLFAFEAEFSAAFASFYFILMLFLKEYSNKR